MSKAIYDIANDTISHYKITVPKKTFFGIDLQQVNKEVLVDSLRSVLRNSPLKDYQDFLDRQDEITKELAGKEKEFIASLDKRIEAFEQEMKEAKEAFDHNLKLKELEFERGIEIKKLEMEHNERMFVSESKFTKEFVENELVNAKLAHKAELENQKAQFENELRIANELAEKTIAHNKAIADAQISKAKEESSILYTYDANILAKKVATEVSDKYDELLQLATKYEAAKELIEKLEEDKAYFQNFAEVRIEKNEDVTDKLLDKINSKDCPPVTVNVTEVKKKKHND